MSVPEIPPPLTPLVPPDEASRHVTFRVNTQTREMLEIVAKESDRAIAQLVRYAVSDMLKIVEDGGVLAICAPRKGEVTKHLGTRLPVSLLSSVSLVADENSVTTSDVLRTAVEMWLPTVSPNSLGSPPSPNSTLASKEAGE